MVEEWKRRRERGKEGNKKRKKKKIQPASVTSDDVTAKRFLSRLDKEGVERGRGRGNGARHPLRERNLLWALATPDVGIKENELPPAICECIPFV